MKNIIYISDLNLPNNSAQSIQILKMCDAFSKFYKTYLFCEKKDIRKIKKKFNLSHTFFIKNFFFINFPIFNIITKLVCIVKLKINKNDILYTRDVHFAFIGYFFFKKLFLELHFPYISKKSLSYYMIFFLVRQKKMRFVFISNQLLKIYQKKFTIKKKNYIIAHSSSEKFLIKKKREKAEISVGYCGHLYQGRGIELIIDLAKKLKNFRFNILGGFTNDLIDIKRKNFIPNNIKFFKYKDYCKINNFLSKNDILIAPYNKKRVYAGQTETSRFMSPLKIFEYMASKRPIVSSDHEVLKEVLKHNKNSILCNPSKFQEWITALTRLKDPKLRKKISDKAYIDFINYYTWDKRVENILGIL